MKYEGSEAADVYLGTAAADLIEGMGGNDTLGGRGGDDIIMGGAGADAIDGGEGDDILFSEAVDRVSVQDWEWTAVQLDNAKARDSLNGGAGDDFIVAGTGDTIDGGDGTDELILSLIHERAGLTLDLEALVAGIALSWGSTTIANVERLSKLRATEFDDEILVGTITGDHESVSIYAGAGDDHVVSASAGSIHGGDGDDVLETRATSYALYGDGGNDRLSGAESSYGGDGDDVIVSTERAEGGGGNDIITATTRKPTSYEIELDGGTGDDTLTGGSIRNLLAGGAGSDVLIGGKSGDSIGTAARIETFKDPHLQLDTGTERDRVEAGAGNDLVSIGFGDSADGGAGRDHLTLSLAGATRAVFADLTGLTAGATVTIGGGTITGFESATAITGTEWADRIIVGGFSFNGGDGDDRLVAAGTGASLYGEDGNDTLLVNAQGSIFDGGRGDDTIRVIAKASQLNGDRGSDTLDLSGMTRAVEMTFSSKPGNGSTVGYIIGFERIIGSGHDDILYASTGTMTLVGGAGNDTLRTGAGAKSVRLEGGAGDDTLSIGYRALNDGDWLSGGGGTDTLSTSDIDLSRSRMQGDIEILRIYGVLTLAAGQEKGVQSIVAEELRVAGAGTLDLRKASVSAEISASKAGNRLLLGNEGYDVRGNIGADVLQTGNGNDVLTGGAGDDMLSGGGGADKLTGGAGADRMAGGDGDDRYLAVDAGDTISEREGGGIDTVESVSNHVLSANVDNLILLGKALNGTGNAIANTITGNLANNVLDGKGGADVLIGGAGNDTYLVDRADDRIVESSSGGTDLVRAYASFTLSANVENLQMMAAGTGTGNTLANVITGSSGADVLIGGGGDDRLTGGAGLDRLIGGTGSDTYYVQDTGDTIVEISGEGADTVVASADYTLSAEIEALVLTGGARAGAGNALDNSLVGSDGNDLLRGLGGLDVLEGGAGDDVLYGGAGPDALYGGAGADRFVFEAGDGHPDPYYLDLVAFFSQGEGDRIDLSPLGHLAFIGTAGFSGGGQVRYDTYVEGTLIEIDLNGDRQVDMNIGINSYLTLTSADFILG